MSKTKTIKLPVDKLKPGLYIDLELAWNQHPFLFRRFKLRSDNEISIIRELGLKAVTVHLNRSSASVEQEEAPSPSDAADKDQLWEEKKQRIDDAAKFRSRRHKRSKEYAERVKQIKNLSKNLKSAPANASQDARELAEAMSGAFDEDSNVLINLVNFGDERFSMSHHTINVAVLSLLLGRAMGFQGRELRWICIGALLHDIGQIAIPDKVLNKREPLTSSEQKLLATHPVLGGKLARQLENIADAVVEIIEQHHEYLDGSGSPQGLSGDQIGKLARIVAIANCYDNLCNPANPRQAATPKAAMALLYAKYKNKLDGDAVQRFIQSMGVYPPGTVVQLSDDSIGLVTAVHSEALLQPQVLLYHPDIPRNEALHLDLRQHPGLSISDALKPGDYPDRIYDYLGISEHTGYYFDRA